VEGFIGCKSIALGIAELKESGFSPLNLALLILVGFVFFSLSNRTIFSEWILNNVRCESGRKGRISILDNKQFSKALTSGFSVEIAPRVKF
jgi:hypothetical protein